MDLEPGVWTKYKIEVEGRKARLYVNGAAQPCLIVNDLKLEPRQGRRRPLGRTRHRRLLFQSEDHPEIKLQLSHQSRVRIVASCGTE